jgi:hypothetical protein
LAQIEGMDDSVDDAIAAGEIGETGHGARPPADLSKSSFDGIRIWYENSGAPPPVELSRE